MTLPATNSDHLADSAEPKRVIDLAEVRAPDLEHVERLSDDLSVDYLEHYGVLPIQVMNGVVTAATWLADVDPQVYDDFAGIFGARLALVEYPEQDIRAAIRKVYGADGVTAEEFIAGMASESRLNTDGEIPLDDLVTLANEAPVVKLVNLLLLEALESRASDVHIEGYAEGLRVRYRVDGVLQDAAAPPAELTPAIISRIKIMAELDIAERRLPQDGRIRLRLQNRQVDVRVSTLPTLRGESVVMRLLDKDRGRIGLAEIGMAADTLERFKSVVSRPNGIILVTGPTGSGKTTTLYAAVDLIRTGREKILTVEDPVEYQLPGVPQVPVNDKIGVTFATALRALLRQDPDVMLIGEIRDGETAEIATQASLTGHLVLSTLHTNDAPSALTRLLELGVAAYLVASTVEAVLAQRLVRTICTKCKVRVPVPDDWARGFDAAGIELQYVWHGTGCPECRNTGYRGRTGIHELLVMSNDLRAEVLHQRGANELRQIAIRDGMRTLQRDGLRLVAEGMTTLEEVLRVTRA
jgi:general secretion pathway protein E